ncbi:MAG: DUF3880 domain-containing protein [Lachnospiraceae bacterium]|nr:DUF3880 domain-containing protein [Lachnospiraceae bacterium]
MKLFIYDWNFITKYDLYRAMQKQGIEYDLFNSKSNPRVNSQSKQFRKDLEKALDNKKYDAIFSINFFLELAEAAHARNILYICWTYDSPALGIANETHFFDTNRIFLFDSSEYEEFQEHGVKNIFYYLPLAADARRLSQMKPTPMGRMKYHADISFVGQLYQSDMDKMFPLFDEYGAGYIAALINIQLNVYGTNFIQELINENLIKRLCNQKVTEALLKNLNHNFFHDVEEVKSWGLIAFLLKAVTNKERILLLTLLAKYYHVKLFTINSPKLPNVKICEPVDYRYDMPLVFKCSKINLNITLRNIRRGIPQRVIDIMGCHALAMTNYQEDLNEYFKDGQDLLIYSSMEEALDKCKYYLSHEKEAEKIRQNGYKIVKDKFSYEHQLNRIWELSGLKNKLSK